MSGNEDHYVYTYVDHDAAPLYVGCTSNPTLRQRAHSAGASWWPQVADYAQMGPFTRPRALAVEANLIDALQPPGNFFHTVVHRRRPLRHDAAACVRARLRAGLLQVEACRALGIAGPYLSRAESGQNNIRPDLLLRLAELYGCDPELLRAPEFRATAAEASA